jgi:hypothetical protein
MLVTKPNGKNQLEDEDIDGRIMLTYFKDTVMWEGVDWIHLAQDRVQWRLLVNTVIVLWLKYTAENFLITWASKKDSHTWN